MAHHHGNAVVAVAVGHAHHAIETALDECLRFGFQVDAGVKSAVLGFAVRSADFLELTGHHKRVVGILHQHQHQSVIGERNIQNRASQMRRVPILLI